MNNIIMFAKFYIVQLPNLENAMSAIVQAEHSSENQSISDFVFANAQSINRNDLALILDAARQDAASRVGLTKEISLSNSSK